MEYASFRQVLLVQSDPTAAQPLAEYFQKRGARVDWTHSAPEALAYLVDQQPDLVFLDVHLPDDGCLKLLFDWSQAPQFNRTATIITNRFPELEKELQIRSYHIHTFLRHPFTDFWIEKALANALPAKPGVRDGSSAGEQTAIRRLFPQLRTPVRLKITLPYIVLALLLAIALTFILTRVVLDSLEQRYLNQLVEAGKLTSDWIVMEESRRLETLRILANTKGLPVALQERDLETLRELALPIVVNTQEEDVHLLGTDGISALTLYHPPGTPVEAYTVTSGETFFQNRFLTQRVLQNLVDARGDKYAELISTPWGQYMYIAGPIYHDNGDLAGIVVVGTTLQTLTYSARESLLGRNNTFAHISMYDRNGAVLASTLLDAQPLDRQEAEQVFLEQNVTSYLRQLEAASIEYTEILGPFELRGGSDQGVVGTAIARQFIVQSSQYTRGQIFGVGAVSLVLIILVGLLVAQMITARLDRVVDAAVDVAEGNLDVRVEPQGTDELALLAHSFNYMVSNIREGAIYRDLLSRTITPQVREQLRDNFVRGELRLEGQSFEATILMTDMRGFTSISEKMAPTELMATLNEYYGILVPIINRYDGVISEFVGDGLMAYFGVFPTPLTPDISARAACRTAVEIMDALAMLNQRRLERGEVPLITGIGINTGIVAGGSLGVTERMHYAIIGDTVNITSRLEGLTRQFGETSAIISQTTKEALGAGEDEFNITYTAEEVVRGRTKPISVYRLQRRDAIPSQAP